VAGEIRRRIIRGELSEGDSLPVESELCKTFQVARPTLREAFRILEAEALISIRQGGRGGPTVHEPTISTASRHVGLLLQHQGTPLRDVHAGFGMIMTVAAKAVAHRHTSADVKRFRKHVAALKETEDIEEFVRLLIDFYRILLKATKNNTLFIVAELLLNALSISRSAQIQEWRSDPKFSRVYIRCAIEGVEQLVESIIAKDEIAAQRHFEDAWQEEHTEALFGRKRGLIDLAP
jgi:DNA-binding FadR family transcriptional regulator